MTLRPDKSVQKLLLSTPAHFVGEFDTQNLLITHAWPPFYTGRPRWFGGNGDSLSRTAIVLSFRTPPPPTPAPGIVVPNYESAGEIVASTLSVLFGKRFDSHGPFEMSGSFGMPELSGFTTPCDPRLRHNDGRPRSNRSVPLNFCEVGRVSVLLDPTEDDRRITAFYSAAKFYRRALLSIESDPEGAYLNLITAGEIVSSFHQLSEDDALDTEAASIIRRIADEMPGGDAVAKFLRNRLRGIKRSFVGAIAGMVDDEFFERYEADSEWGTFKKENFRRHIAAAYDLRSRFVHSGDSFGRWISHGVGGSEIMFGQPTVRDREMSKILSRAPLFNGLERAIRYVILTFAAALGADVEVTDNSATDKVAV